MAINRRETGITGLDKLILGGFPIPSTVLIGGEPGTGKTTLSVQTLFNGAKKGEVGAAPVILSGMVSGFSSATWIALVVSFASASASVGNNQPS